ncbi:MAG: GNAT family N-acetyltransferase [Candidatus Alcyoniella australis]|nr:GNAT family N-acetyltransferase [Candidatus Alcyoniella australis]
MSKSRFDPNWQQKYKDMIVTSEQAVSQIKPGHRVFIGTGCAQPQELVRALTARSQELVDVEIIHFLALGEAPYAHKKLRQHFRVNSFFISENVRDTIQEGLGDYTPIFLSDIPRLFDLGQLPLDAALIQVSPPDERGMVSLGIAVDIVKSAAENASLVIAQVNPQMPRTHGDSMLHITDMDLLVYTDVPLLYYTPQESTEVTRKVAQNIASLIEDGCTIEIGIGRIPQAVLEFLRDRKDLGIHTEMLSDAVIDLIESGAVTGKRKSREQGKIVASFAMGTRRLYDYIDDNETFGFHPTEYVNDPFVIGQQHKMVSMNVALEVDLTGQVCADSLGEKFFSGIGGQVDFNRGAARSINGKAIIALPSTAKNGTISRIVTRLTPGAGVVTTRGDVHYVATEHGVAYLHGKSVQARSMALISIADPKFRAQLLREAIEYKFVRSELSEVEGKIMIAPEGLRTTYLINDGTQINFRPIHPTDMPLMQDMFYELSQQTVYYRFMSRMKHLPQKQIQNFVFVDHRQEVAIVGTIPEAHGEDIIAMGSYYLDKATNLAEVAFIVRDDWQDKGIGTYLLKYLMLIAKRNGIRGFTAEVLAQNHPMQSVMHKSGSQLTSHLSGGVFSFKLEF